jgi:hypothetical protein
MNGDFSRLTFNPRKHYRAVRMQQGRVQLDADWNEQSDIISYARETLLKDLLGSSGAPTAQAGFRISLPDDQEEVDAGSSSNPEFEQESNSKHQETPAPDLHIASGHYYVDGILCENEQELIFSQQSTSPYSTSSASLKDFVVVYLDAWIRHITYFEDSSLRETALGGIDTATREQTAWRVKLLPLSKHPSTTDNNLAAYEHILTLPEWRELLDRQENKGLMAARLALPTTLENQLYRVEIHNVHNDHVTFKWSRENGSVRFALTNIEEGERKNATAQYVVTLTEQLRDQVQLRKGDWVEFVNTNIQAEGHTFPLYQVINQPDFTSQQLVLAGQYSQGLAELVKSKGASLLLQRWDYDVNRTSPPSDGVTVLHEDEWLDLERGIQVRFAPDGIYHQGDYWLLPSRTFTGIEWPSDEQRPLALPPEGIYHHYCPLALLHFARGRWRVVRDLRPIFETLPAITARIKKDEREEHPARRLVETYESDEELAIGDLVSLVPMTKNRVSRAKPENARLLLGVVTGREIGDRTWRYQVTTYGRAHCKVVGPVEWGDLLTVSHRGGCARVLRSDHIASHHGTILGKALDAYLPDDEEGMEMIEVMVTLQ